MQQKHAATLGMWAFLATEVLFSAVCLLHIPSSASAIRRRGVKAAAICWNGPGRSTPVCCWQVAWQWRLAVHFADHKRRIALTVSLAVALLCGVAFLGIKGYEYHEEYEAHFIPGILFDVSVRSGPPPTFLFLLFYDDRPACHSYDRRHWLADLSALHGMAWPLHRPAKQFQRRRDHRTVLAFCGLCLDIPVSTALYLVR